MIKKTNYEIIIGHSPYYMLLYILILTKFKSLEGGEGGDCTFYAFSLASISSMSASDVPALDACLPAGSLPA